MARSPQTVLGDGETHLWYGKPAYEAYLESIIIACFLIFLSLWVNTSLQFGNQFSLLLFVPSILILLRIYSKVNSLSYYVTNIRIVREVSLLSRSRQETTLDQVTNVLFNQGLFQRVFDFGNVTLYTAGSGAPSLILESVKDPVLVRRIIMNAKNTYKSSIFCNFCGFPLRPNVSYCPKCGKKQ